MATKKNNKTNNSKKNNQNNNKQSHYNIYSTYSSKIDSMNKKDMDNVYERHTLSSLDKMCEINNTESKIDLNDILSCLNEIKDELRNIKTCIKHDNKQKEKSVTREDTTNNTYDELNTIKIQCENFDALATEIYNNAMLISVEADNLTATEEKIEHLKEKSFKVNTFINSIESKIKEETPMLPKAKVVDLQYDDYNNEKILYITIYTFDKFGCFVKLIVAVRKDIYNRYIWVQDRSSYAPFFLKYVDIAHIVQEIFSRK